jgi:hypothetical protein
MTAVPLPDPNEPPPPQRGLTREERGRDVDTRGDFTVVIGRDDLQVTDEPQQRTDGDGETDIDIVLPSPVFRAGETISGSITLTPKADMSVVVNAA